MSDLLVRVALDESGIDGQLKGVLGKFRKIAKELAGVTVPLAAVLGIERTVDALANLGEQAIKSAGALYDQARQLGVTAEALQEYRLIASAAGVSSEQFDKALAILNRTIGNSALGKGDFEKTLAAVGLSLRDHEGHVKSVATVYDELSGKVRDGSLSQAQSIALAAAAFGRDGGKMVEVLRQTEAQQRAVIDAAREYGAILSNDVVAAADEYGDKLELIQKGTEALKTQSELVLAPLTLKWAAIKNEIAGSVAELARASGLIDDNATLQQRRLKKMEETIRLAREAHKITAPNQPEAEDAYLGSLVRDYSNLRAEIYATKKAAEAASAAIVPTGGDSGGVDVPTADEQHARTKAANEAAAAAKAAAEYELHLVTEVAAEKERISQLEFDQEQEWADVMATERERVYAEQLQQEKDWATVLADERARAAAMDLVSFIQRETLFTQAAKDGAQQRLDFQKMTSGMQVKTVIDGLVSQTAGLAQYNKKMFEVNKIAAEAQAVISTAQGIAKGVALGWPLGIPAVAWAAATGAAQIQAIRSQTFAGGGKGTTPSAAGSTPVVNDTPVGSGAGAGGRQRLLVEGIDPSALFSGGAVRDLARRLLEFQRDGGEVVLPP